ncbi:MAG TPA: NAD(P)H-hydrate dehydratase [Actinomycetota bacterium]|nr:NAD(P)H-hydrate dehydratase [Actinomycetota bacterium]
MKPLATVAAVQAADRAAQERGTGVEELMGRAGAAVAAAAVDELGRVAGRRVVALAGKGHNGGDALEALARLARRGAGAEALVTGDPDDLDAQGRRCVALVRRAGGRVRAFDAGLAKGLLSGADLVLDGLLGTGSSGAPRGPVAEAIAAAEAPAAPVVAVDIPSGVDGATGQVAGQAVTAAVTVTFQAVKPGHVLPPGSDHVGRLEVADIGLPLEPGRWGVSEAADLAGLVPVPRAEQHKRSRGVLLLVGGSPGMGGAPTLMGLAARRAGTGLLVLAVPASVVDRVGAAVPEALTVALPESGGGLARNADDACRRWLGEATAIGVGPGLGRADGTQKVVRGLLAAYDGPAVVDADALFALGTGGPLAERRGPTLLTPHAGEFARLAPDASGTRLDEAAGRAGAWGATVLLKGNDTVIADPDGRLAVNPTGVPALATGGTGDVLTGLTASLLCQGLSPFDAGRLGTWVHGRAAALAAAELGPVSVAAGDVAGPLPGAFRELLREGSGEPRGVPRCIGRGPGNPRGVPRCIGRGPGTPKGVPRWIGEGER